MPPVEPVTTTPGNTAQSQVTSSQLPGRRRRRQTKPLLLLALVVLLLLSIGGSILGQRYYSPEVSTTPVAKTTIKKTTAFVAPPLSSQQIDDLRHLSTHMQDRQLAYLSVARMSLAEEIGQVMMVEYQENSYSPDLDAMVHDMHAGGVIMYQRQINTLAQTRADTARMQKRATFPLLISADEEGWNVHRLTNIYPPRLSARDIHDSGSTTVAAREGTKVAHDLLSVGINTNFAPDVDVSSNDGYIGWDQRSFGSTAADVIKYVGPYMKAMQTGGVIATVKHFPGLGSAPKTTDPHAVFVTINETKQQLYDKDLLPFEHFIHASDKMEQPGIVMTTDEFVPSIDPTYISELSPTFVTDILRKQIGYNGVIVTDALTMLGVQVNGQHVPLADAGVMALKAGNDLLLGPQNAAEMRVMVTAIENALKNGALSKSRLDDAATHILTLKMERGLVPAVPPANS
ncbi:hypothetical protein KDI_25730 [Dictyobacter arantiisoli]|uniref:beta-N-acetylhexosaminidase n=2 Tax=Dictyobacter arantiisoli TaxID=2014874 RepID=A0A5A5TDA1_9CHLR|nr:hypothetical protein KDI_25730 [Dictyobacter arantiisoli]